MQRIYLLIAGVVIGVVVLVVAWVTYNALRDKPARPAIGNAQLTTYAGSTLEYFSRGPAAGEPLILLASYARSVSDFNELVVGLNAAGYRTLAIQARGIGNSTLSSLQPSLFDYAEDVAQVLKAEALRSPVTVIGHAFGNRIARAFASRHPAQVKQLILISAGESAPPPAVRNNIMAVLFGIGSQAHRKQALHAAFFAPEQSPPPHWYTGWYPRAGLAQGYATANTPADQWRAAGGRPMLILESRFDAAAAEAGQHLQQQYPSQVSLRELPRAGHAALPEQGTLIRRYILDYLQEGHE